MIDTNARKGKKLQILAFCLIFGIIFLFLSEYSDTKENSGYDGFDETEYAKALEERLCEILEQMEGVSQVKVMITLGSSKAYHFSSPQSNPDSFFVSGSTKTDDAILTSVDAPTIQGVCVVCKGAKNASVRLKITRLVSSTLNLSDNQIYVTE